MIALRAVRRGSADPDSADPDTFFMGQTVDVRGTVKYLKPGEARPGIEVNRPDQVQFVNPK
jgi:hypothetical protein